MKISSSCNIKSHPDKLLLMHLNNVTDYSREIFSLKQISGKYDKKIISDIIFFTSISHDFGKCTKYFQDYLFEKNSKKKDYLRTKKETHHSLISAVFCYFIVSKYLENRELLEVYPYNILPYISYLIVKRHHGNIKEEFVREFTIDDNDKDILKKQLNSIDLEEINKAFCELTKEYELDNICLAFENEFEKIFKRIRVIRRNFNKYVLAENIETFFITKLLFSLLIDADKLDAGVNNPDLISNLRKDINSFSLADGVDEHKNAQKDKEEKKINKLRDAIYNEVTDFCYGINLDQKIYSLNVPTGTGKTFASINFALKVKEKLKQEKNISSKIIYCLPFTSIIDQNYSEIVKILKSNNIEVNSNVLLKHHYLSDVNYTNTEDEFSIDKSLLLTESWMSSIIVTSFVQLFNTLLSNQNRTNKKFHNLVNSIIILDEVQSVPGKYRKLVNEVLKTFSNLFNTYFILVTATQPIIFEPDEIEEVVKKKEDYFKSELLDRIELEVDLQEKTLEDFKAVLANDISENEGKNFLIILNTIKSSQEIFTYLSDNFSDSEVLYLSTSILPRDRLKIIKKVKKNKRKKKGKKKGKKKRIILVSTQVVEAGVDIDLDVVYRDMAPLDCIFQSAGRCNRNSEGARGKVKVVYLVNSNHNNNPFCGYIYGNTLIDNTMALFKSKKVFSENEFLDLSNKYYQGVKVSQDDSAKFIDYMKELNFNGMKEFKLIDDTLKSFDFFVELNQDARDLMTEFNTINAIEDKIERKNEFLKIKKDFYSYVVSVNLKGDQKKIFEGVSKYEIFKDSLYRIPFGEKDKFYQQNGIGFNLDHYKQLDKTGLII